MVLVACDHDNDTGAHGILSEAEQLNIFLTFNSAVYFCFSHCADICVIALMCVKSRLKKALTNYIVLQQKMFEDYAMHVIRTIFKLLLFMSFALFLAEKNNMIISTNL